MGHDLMERLAAADPVRDAEALTPDEQREADALLARLLATPAGPPRSRLRRGALAAVGAACAAVAAFVAIDLVDSGAPGPGVVDRAVAAVTRAGVVYHLVEFTTVTASGDAGEAPPDVLAESWYTSDGRMHRKAFTVRSGEKGRLVEDFAGRRLPGRATGSALRWDGFTNTISESGFGRDDGGIPGLDGFADPGAQLRALQEQQRLRPASTTTVDGKRAHRLVSGEIAMGEDEVEIEFTVDAETYLPLSHRFTLHFEDGRTMGFLTRYRVYERLPLDASSGRLLALDPHPDAKCSEFAHELTEERDLGFPNPCAGR